MSFRKHDLRVSPLTAAVRGALAAMVAFPTLVIAAEALEDEVALIRKPTNFVSVGAESVSRGSAKFGEYNGLDKSGVDAIGNFSLRGGDAYEGGDGTTRWAVTGSDLGTTSREATASISNQGRWNFGIGYDELRHNITSTYQTPYKGNLGDNNFTLPASFGAAVSTAGNGTRVLGAGPLSSYHNLDIASTRRNTSLAGGINLGPQWTVKLDYNHLEQTGAKLMGFGQYATGGATGEAVAILPNPTNYKTDTVNLALNWTGDKGHVSGSYFGSFFRDGYDRVTFQSYAGAINTQTMSTPPGNNFHQLSLAGGYAFTSKTKVAGSISYARNTQNDSFVYDTYQMMTPSPRSSLDGLVDTTHADLKLTDRSIANLALSGGFKYDRRDNRTESNIYDFNAISGGNRATYPNTPLSYRRYQYNLGGDYRLGKTQHILAAYEHEDVARWCNQYAAGAGYPAGTNCVVATAAREDKVSATYKLKASEAMQLNAGYTYAVRKTDADINAIAAMIGTNGNVPPGTVKGLNAGDFIGFRPYFDEDRKQHIVKLGSNWQAAEQLSFGFSGRYARDSYDELYGWKSGHQWSVNLDSTYSYSEKGSVSAYVTRQERRRERTDKQNNAAVTATATRISVPANSSDSGTQLDEDLTFGLSVKHGGLFGNKLELLGDLLYSLSKTRYGTRLNYTGTTTGGLTCSDPSILSCVDLPDISNKMIQARLAGNYQVDKAATISLVYLYRHLRSDDYYYNGLQYGYTPTSLLPTNQDTPTYSVSLVAVTYTYSFK
jgi:MtrB/PioB family decaheme-associated outer membrane protein